MAERQARRHRRQSERQGGGGGGVCGKEVAAVRENNLVGAI
jgi:hypothetical protein